MLESNKIDIRLQNQLDLDFDQNSESFKAYWEARGKQRYPSDDPGLDQLRHLQIERLVYEYQQLLDYQNNTDRQILYAVDPHLIKAYCDYWDFSNFTGFRFLNSELRGGGERERFYLQLLSSIFSNGRFIVLESGRKRISEHLSYFADSASVDTTRLDDTQLVSKIADAFDICEFVANSDVTRRDYLLKREFRNFTASKSLSEFRTRVAIQRMNRLFGSGNFYSLNDLLSAEGVEENNKREIQSTLHMVDRFGNFATKNNESLERLFAIYTEKCHFKKDSVATSHNDLDELDFNVKKSEHLNRNALLELHKINCVFEHLKINAECKYLTASSRLFNFIRPLSKTLNVSLVHPRYYSAYNNQKFYSQIKGSMDAVLTQATASNKWIIADGKVTNSELDKYNEMFGKIAGLLRDANTFGSADFKVKEKAASDIDSVFQDTMQWLETVVETQNVQNSNLKVKFQKFRDSVSHLAQIETSIGSHFSKVSEITPDLLNGVILGKSNTASATKKIFTKLTTLLDERHKPRISVRLVKSEIDETDELTQHLVCLPLTGGYRYTFSIYNSDVLGNLDKEKYLEEAIVLSVDELLADIQAALKGVNPANVKNKALLNYIEAIHAASYKDWTLSNHLAKKSLEILSGYPDDRKNYQYCLFASELNFSLHLFERALAEVKFRGLRQIQLLKSSFEYLAKSKYHVEYAYKRNSRSSPFKMDKVIATPISIRIVLAYAGLLTELLVVHKKMAVDYKASELDLPEEALNRESVGDKTADDPFAWRMASFTNISFSQIWENQNENVKILRNSIARFALMLNQNFHENSDLDNRVYSRRLWNFRIVRACQLLIALEGMIESGLILNNSNVDRSLEVHKVFEDAMLRHKEYTKILDPYAQLPYSNILISDVQAEKIIDELSQALLELEPHDLNIKSMKLQLERHAVDCAKEEEKLDELGLPRRHSQRIRRKLEHYFRT